MQWFCSFDGISRQKFRPGKAYLRTGRICPATEQLSGDAAGGFNTESFLDGLDAQAVIKKLDEFATQVAPAAEADKNTIAGSSEDFSNAGTNLGSTLVSGITDAGDGSGMTGLCNGMIAQIRSFEGRFKSAGLYLGTGLVNGLKNSQALAVAAAGALARAMLAKIRSVFNEHSPSKETELDGFYLVKGLANGVTKNTRIATCSVEGMGDSVLKSMGRTITTLSDAMNMDFNEDLVIRPVVDFSNVTTGARTINGTAFFKIGDTTYTFNDINVSYDTSNWSSDTVWNSKSVCLCSSDYIDFMDAWIANGITSIKVRLKGNKHSVDFYFPEEAQADTLLMFQNFKDAGGYALLPTYTK